MGMEAAQEERVRVVEARVVAKVAARVVVAGVEAAEAKGHLASRSLSSQSQSHR